MFFVNGNLFQRVFSIIIVFVLLSLLVQSLVTLLPVGIGIWLVYRLYKYIRKIIAVNSEKRESESFVEDIQIMDDDLEENIVDVEYEDI